MLVEYLDRVIFYLIRVTLVAHDGNCNVSFVRIGAVLPQKDALPDAEVALAFVDGYR